MPNIMIFEFVLRVDQDKLHHLDLQGCTVISFEYRIYLAIRQDFCVSRMTTNNLISPMKFCCYTSFTLPKQFQRSRSIL